MPDIMCGFGAAGPSSVVGSLGGDNAVWVDPVSGDDTTGARSQIQRPFKTIQAAVNASLAGDEVVVTPGTFVETVTLPIGGGKTLQSWGAQPRVNAPARGSEGGVWVPEPGGESLSKSRFSCNTTGAGV